MKINSLIGWYRILTCNAIGRQSLKKWCNRLSTGFCTEEGSSRPAQGEIKKILFVYFNIFTAYF